MLAAISPAAYNFEETLNTLQYADRAKAIQLKARKNEQMTEVGKLKAEIDALKAELAAQGGGAGGALSTEQQARGLRAECAARARALTAGSRCGRRG